MDQEKKRKRKAGWQKVTPPKKKMQEEGEELISPSSKITVFKVDVISCSNQSISNLELGNADLEEIWSDTLLCELNDLSGYMSFKAKNNSEIRIQYQLKQPMSIKSIVTQAEFTHERTTARGTEVLRCRAVGLGEVREVVAGETIKATVVLPNFEITPEQIIAWLTPFGRVLPGHR
jgi:hypothetical protein